MYKPPDNGFFASLLNNGDLYMLDDIKDNALIGNTLDFGFLFEKQPVAQTGTANP
jgi:hypothetical protein